MRTLASNTRYRWLALMALILIACSDDDPTGTANFDPRFVTMHLRAEVEDVSDFDNLLGGAVTAGVTITATYVYDSRKEDSNGLATVGDYRYTAAPYGITVEAGGLVFRTDPDNVDFLLEVINNHLNPARDGFVLRSYENLALNDTVTVDHISWQLIDATATAWDNDELTADPVDVSAFDSSFGLEVEGSHVDSGEEFWFRAHVTATGRLR